MDAQTVDHVELYVGDAYQTASFLRTAFGFRVYGQGGPETGLAGQRSLLLGQGRIRLLLTSGLVDAHPASRHVRRHGDGVACLGLRTGDAALAFAEATGNGALPVTGPVTYRRGAATAVVASVSGPGGLTYRFVQRDATAEFLPGAIDMIAPDPDATAGLLNTVDHLAMCVPAGELDQAARGFQEVLGFAQTFTERVEEGGQAMDSAVVQSRSREVTVTLVAPDPAAHPGQLDDFLRAYGGAGVQHLAFGTHDIAAAVASCASNGVRFLPTPASYYDALERRLAGRPSAVPLATLRARQILADRDHWGELFQIFTESTVVRRTLFFELIERHGALTFGSNNIRALYQAKERERAHAPAG